MKIVLTSNLPKVSHVVVGVPGPGLCGPLTADFLIKDLQLEEIGYIESDELPPVIPIHDGVPKRPIRIYAGKDLIVIVSEVGLSRQQVKSFTKAIKEFLKPLKPELVIVLGGLEDADGKRIYAISNHGNNYDFDVINHGATTGTMALLLLSDLPVLALLAPVKGNVDIKASTQLLKGLEVVLGKKLPIPKSALSLLKQKKKKIDLDNSIYG